MGSTYLPAHAVAGIVRDYFSSCEEAARQRGDAPPAPAPDEPAIEEMVSAAFWASLRPDEGRSPTISLAYVAPDRAGEPMTFAAPLPLQPAVLARVAPAVERPGIHLGVWRIRGELHVWGATDWIPPSCFVVEVIEPGLLVVKRRRRAAGDKYANVAVLQGDHVRIVDERGDLSDRLPSMASALGFSTFRAWTDPLNVIVQLALSMRGHRHGGLLLVVPRGSDEWRRSVREPVPYLATPPFGELTRLLVAEPPERDRPAWRDAMRRAVAVVAGLTAVDGATVIDDAYAVLAFGVKIRRSPSSSPVERVVVVEPVVGSRPEVVDAASLGGTRHLSAAQFVHDQHHALALVASQDGRFTVFGWPPGQDAVHAHRIEALLM
jgi:hypothetical protein